MKFNANFEFALKKSAHSRYSWILLLPGLLSMIIAFGAYHMQKSEVTRQQSIRAMDAIASQQYLSRDATRANVPNYIAGIGKALYTLNQPWNQLLKEIEFVNGENVNVAKLDYGSQSGSVQIIVLTTNYDALINLINRLDEASGENDIWNIRKVNRNANNVRVLVVGKMQS